MAGCRTADCTRVHYALGLCRRHYQNERNRRQHQPLTVAEIRTRWPSVTWDDRQRAAATTDRLLDWLLDDMARLTRQRINAGLLHLDEHGHEITH